jgi:hypothetical protein
MKTITTKTKKNNIMQRPITSRVRDNKNISKDPARQPILHVGNVSPLKQVQKGAGAYLETSETTEGTPGTTEKKVTPGKVIGGGAPRKMSNEAWEEYLANETPEQKEARLKREVERGWREPDKVEVVETEGTPGGTKTEEVPLLTRDKGTALTPYQQYQAKLMYNRATRAEKGSERKQQRDLAKEYGRQKGGNLYQKFKARRDVMTGRASLKDFEDAFGSKEAGLERFGQAVQNYEVYRGLSDAQQSASASAEGARRQYNQRRAAGSSVVMPNRLATPTDIGRADTQAQIGTEPDAKVKFKGGEEETPRVYTSTDTIGKSALRMMDRHMSSVGMKQPSALKKGYFKGK